MDAFKSFLAQAPGFTAEAFDLARPHLSVRSAQPGEYLLRQGQVCREIYFIEEGLLRQYYLLDGREVTNCFCRHKTISASYKSLLTQEESEISIQAVEASTLLVLPADSLRKLYEQHTFWQQMGRLAAENEYLTSSQHHRFLADLSATDRYLQILEKDPELLQRVPLTYLASYLQIAPETLSRIRHKLART